MNDPATKEPIILDAPHQIRGGTYAENGTDEAWLSVTFNYARWYRRDGVFTGHKSPHGFDGIRSIDGMTGAESIPVLKHAISVLESTEDDLSEEEVSEYNDTGVFGYWVPTRANAIRPLYGLLAFAQLHPDGVWDVD